MRITKTQQVEAVAAKVDWPARARAAEALLREVLDLPHVTPVNGIGRRIREHLEKP